MRNKNEQSRIYCQARQWKVVDMEQISQDEIWELCLSRGLTLENLLDVVIENNGIIGVGLISLADSTSSYILGTRPKSQRGVGI